MPKRPPRPKPRHASLDWIDQQVARAEYFTALTYAGGVREKIERPSLAEVVAGADSLGWVRPMFYAVTKGDRLSIFIADARERLAKEAA